MNIAYFLLPKEEVTYLREEMTVRQGLEKLRRSGFTAVPVIDGRDRYVGTVSEGDFLWSILHKEGSLNRHPIRDLEQAGIRDVMTADRIRPVCIDTDMDELLEQAQNQNFVPVIDDRSVFIGIITRKDIIRYFAGKSGK